MIMANNRDSRQSNMTDNGDDRQWKWQIMGMVDDGNDRQWGW